MCISVCSQLKVIVSFMICEEFGFRNAVQCHRREMVEIEMSSCVIRALQRWAGMHPVIFQRRFAFSWSGNLMKWKAYQLSFNFSSLYLPFPRNGHERTVTIIRQVIMFYHLSLVLLS